MHTIRSPKQAMRTHNTRSHERSVGGTNNMARHLYGGVDGTNTNRNFAVVTDKVIRPYVPATTSYGYSKPSANTVPGNRRSDGTVFTHETDYGIDPVILASYTRRANELGITLYAYLVRMCYID